MNFTNLLQSKAIARQNALNAVGTNPPQAVTRATVNCSGDASTSSIPAANSGVQAKKKGNGQEQVQTNRTLRPKRPCEEESSPTNKRPPPPIRDTSGTQNQLREEEVDNPSQRRNVEISTRSSPSNRPSWHQDDFQLLISQRGLMNLPNEIQKSAPILTGLYLTNPRVGHFLGVGLL